jgi:RimJ/RimL family protein N-acetyltransferase
VDDPDLLRLHAHVLFDIDERGRLLRVNEPDADPPPRLFLARGRRTELLWVRHDVPPPVEAACRQAASLLPDWDGQPTDPPAFEPLRRALEAPDAAVETGPAFHFGARVSASPGDPRPVRIDETNADLLDRHFPYTRRFLSRRHPVVGIVLDGAVVAACFSARQRAGGHEAGVATEEPVRGRGFATRLVDAWRDAVEDLGAEPLYSTTWDNAASRSVARKLGLVPYAETVSIG